MSTIAKVGSIDALRQFRAALVKFAETANVALGDAESEIQRVITWVEHDQATYWSGQLRKRQDALVKAKEALRMKQIFKDPTGARQPTIEEEKAVQLAMRRLDEADQKMANVRRWSRQLEKEFHLYRGGVQRLGTSILADVPAATAKLDRMTIALNGYVTLAGPTEATSTAEPSAGASMAKAPPGPPQPGDVYRSLRKNSPPQQMRDRISAGDPTKTQWPQPLPEIQRQRLDAMQVDRVTLDPGAIVIYAGGDLQQAPIYLHRIDPAFPGDSGWYIAPTQTTSPALETARAQQLEELWPDLQTLLQFPPGFILVIDRGGMAAILDSSDNPRWSN